MPWHHQVSFDEGQAPHTVSESKLCYIFDIFLFIIQEFMNAQKFILCSVASAAQFSKWERDRRLRFNALLDRLAALLPGYQLQSSTVPAGEKSNHKWSKAQIIDNAIRHIKNNCTTRNDAIVTGANTVNTNQR